MREAWIIDGVRTPRGRGKATGALHGVHPQELLGQVLNALVERTGIDPSEVEDVAVGNGIQWGDHGDSIGRMSVLAAGWPVEVPAVTMNRFCGSGQQAVTYAAQGVLSGTPGSARRGRASSPCRGGRPVTDTRPSTAATPKLRERYPTVPQGISADLIATLEGFSRADVDAYAAQSQERCAKALAECTLRRLARRRPGRRRQGRAGHGGVSPSGYDRGEPRQACSRPSKPWARPSSNGLTAPSTTCAAWSTRRFSRSTTSITRATPPASSTGQPRSWWRRRTTPQPTACGHAPGSA